MARIHIAFQAGFRNDEVVLSISGKEVFRKAKLTTRLRIGMAHALDLLVRDEPFELHLEFPGLRLRKSILLDPAKPVYLGVSLPPAGDPVLVVSHDAHGYL